MAFNPQHAILWKYRILGMICFCSIIAKVSDTHPLPCSVWMYLHNMYAQRMAQLLSVNLEVAVLIGCTLHWFLINFLRDTEGNYCIPQISLFSMQPTSLLISCLRSRSNPFWVYFSESVDTLQFTPPIVIILARGQGEGKTVLWLVFPCSRPMSFYLQFI